MIDHSSVSVSDPAVSKAFYEAALAPLGYRVVMEFGPVTGLGGPTPGASEDSPVHADLWLGPAGNPTVPGPVPGTMAGRCGTQEICRHRASRSIASIGTPPTVTRPPVGSSRPWSH